MEKKFNNFNIFKIINFREYTILYALIIMWIIFYFTTKEFGTFSNITNILRQSSFVGIAAIGMTFCIITRNFDLSIGSGIALLSLQTIWLVPILGLIATLIVILISGFILGIFNGFLIAKIRIPSFIATLGTFFILRAVAYILTGGSAIKFNENWFTKWGSGNFLNIPIPFIAFFILTIIGTLLLRATLFGRHVLAVGNSESASKLCGINNSKIIMIVFGLVGLFTAISAFFVSSRLRSANPSMLSGFEFEVIAAVVLGGTPLAGGKGSIFNTFISSIFIVSISNVLILNGVDSFIIQVITGFILLFAFSLNTIRLLIEQVALKFRK